MWHACDETCPILSSGAVLRYQRSTFNTHGKAVVAMDDTKRSREAARLAREREKLAEKKRLAQSLRANLNRRKTQARARREGDEDGRDGLPASSSTHES